jgi:hypothetical protein
MLMSPGYDTLSPTYRNLHHMHVPISAESLQDTAHLRCSWIWQRRLVAPSVASTRLSSGPYCRRGKRICTKRRGRRSGSTRHSARMNQRRSVPEAATGEQSMYFSVCSRRRTSLFLIILCHRRTGSCFVFTPLPRLFNSALQHPEGTPPDPSPYSAPGFRTTRPLFAISLPVSEQRSRRR